MKDYKGNEPKIAWICPHGGGQLRFHTEEWERPIHSFTNWTRFTNSHLFYGQDHPELLKDRLSKYDGFFFMCSPGRLGKMIPEFKKLWPDKPIAVLTDGYSHDFVEARQPEFAFWDAVQKHVSVILGNRPDNSVVWAPLTDTPYRWLGFPCEFDEAAKFWCPYPDRPRDVITVFRAPGSLSAMLGIEREWPGRFTFTMFKSPVHEQDKRRCADTKEWPEQFGLRVKRWGDEAWQVFLRRSAQSYLALQYDLAGGMGRFITDMAALKIPTIVTTNVGRSAHIPGLHVDLPKDGVTGPIKAIQFVDTLTDSEYRGLCEQAFNAAMSIYGVAPSLIRYHDVLDLLFPGWR